tara:strand:+ start:309 stop:1025 length:717 start_codon:yes stop_codon:yes gene_type:complete
MSNKEAIAAFIKAQAEMGKATKSATNPFHRSKYADLETVLDVVTEPFNDNGFALMQTGGSDETGKYILTKLTHTSGGEFESKIYLVDQFKDKDDNLWPLDMQHLGSAITYAKRYGLQALTGLATEDDDGNSTMRQNVVKKPPPPKPQPKPQPKKPDPEVEHDAAVREEQNSKPSNTPQQLKELIDDKIKKATETWHLKNIPKEHSRDFNVIKKHDAKMSAELNAYYKTRWEQLNTGER